MKPVRLFERAFSFLNSMPKQGFSNQWIEIARVGDFVDAKGTSVKIDDDFLNAVIVNFNASHHEPPIVIGHPGVDAPAFGWTEELRRKGDRLEARFTDTNDEFEKMVKEGAFRKRSSSFYTQPPVLKHVGFLGAMPPAIKGLKNIQFNDGDSVTVEISFNEEKIMDKENEKAPEETKTFREFMKEIFGGGQQSAPAPVNFSEAQAQNLIETAVKKATETITADFNEKLTAKDTVIETLTEKVNGISSSGKHAEIVSFVESIPATSGKHFLKRAGVVEFLESLADADAKDTGKAVVCFSETDDGTREEIKFSRLDWAKELLSNLPPMIYFGEGFSNLKASVEADIAVNPTDLSELRGAMGVKTAEGGAK